MVTSAPRHQPASVARDAEALQGGNAQRIPPSPEPGHAPGLPEYRRNRVSGGTFCFTANLPGRRSDLLATQIGALRAAVRKARGRKPLSYRRLGWAARAYALPVDTAGGRCRPSRPLVGDQDGIPEIPAGPGTPGTADDRPRRTRHLAATIPGTHDPRRAGLRRSYGRYALQPGETWLRGTAGGLALFVGPTWHGAWGVERGVYPSAWMRGSGEPADTGERG